jgi:protein N-terminal amidase
VLPELAFTGYIFTGAAHVRALAEPVGAGVTHRWCAALAARLQAHVVTGFVELRDVGQLYNAQTLVSPTGAVLACHRKKHLFATDKTWAKAGDSWTAVQLAPLRVRVCLGVCMDINPYEFQAPWSDYELARFAVASKASLVLFSSAWCDRSPDDPPDYVPPPTDAGQTLSYWASRLVPLARAHAAPPASSSGAPARPQRAHFVCADRTGREGSTNFCGCSCVIALGGVDAEDGGVRPCATVLSALGVAEEGVLLVDVDVPTDDDAE